MRSLLIAALLFAPVAADARPASTPVPRITVAPPPQSELDMLFPLVERALETGEVLRGRAPAEASFAPRFLAEISSDKLREIGRNLTTQFGPIVEVADVRQTSRYAAAYNIRFEKGIGRATITVEPEKPYRIIGFYISDVAPLDNSPEAIQKAFTELSGDSGFTITRLGDAGPQEVLGFHADQQLAIGSSFKLWVLDALAEDIAQGRRKWSDVVPLSARSLPSGVMQGWPQGSPVTLATLATQMISISDNTATDTLMKLLGRDAIAARVRATGHSDPAKMLPMLTTLEAFTLKAGPIDDAAAYSQADEAGQAAILNRIDPGLAADKVDAAMLSFRPTRVKIIEWFASPRDLVGVMQSLHRRKDPLVMQILSVNPGLGPDVAKQFNAMAFKGGSEEGVLNLTWLVQNKAGDWFVVSQSWNSNAPNTVNQNHFVALARQLLERIK